MFKGGVDADQVSLSPDGVRLLSGDSFAGRHQDFLKQIARPAAEPFFVRGDWEWAPEHRAMSKRYGE